MSAPDVIDRLAELSAGDPVARLRQARAEVRQATQGSFDALFAAAPDDGLPPLERELAALRVAALQRDAALAEFHRERARAHGVGDARLFNAERLPPHPAGADRWEALLRFVDRLTLTPHTARPEHLHELQRHGLTPLDIVTLAQLISFVNYQVRVLAGLRALDAPHDADTAATACPRAATDTGFTLVPLEWAAWLPTVDPEHATPDQILVLEESNAQARRSPYYLTLVHNPAVLRQRSKLFNAIMYGIGGLPRAERELATVAVSRINGCPYCASVHGRLFAQLTKTPQVIEAIFAEGIATALAPRQRAIVDAAAVLSANPPAFGAPQLHALRDAGLDDDAILDVVHAAAIFAWANRLMQTLGEPVAPS
jgi:uncharacterized peroxidase-related enzyme